MADIELVIKIPKQVYNYICKYEHIANSDISDIKDAIINGKPVLKIPKEIYKSMTDEEIKQLELNLQESNIKATLNGGLNNE